MDMQKSETDKTLSSLYLFLSSGLPSNLIYKNQSDFLPSVPESHRIGTITGVRRLYCRWRISLRPETTYEVLPKSRAVPEVLSGYWAQNQSSLDASAPPSAGGSSICRSNSSSSPQAGQLISPSSSIASSTSKTSPQEGHVTS